jgi:hypothetical protein
MCDIIIMYKKNKNKKIMSKVNINLVRFGVLALILASSINSIVATSQRFQMIRLGEIGKSASLDIKKILDQDRIEIEATLAKKQQPVSQCESLKKLPLQRGQSGTIITELQKCMQDDGFYNWPNGFTGYYGPYTEDNFKKWINSSVKSVSAPDITATIATKNDQKPNDTECTKLKFRSWKIGQSGDDVKNLQLCMQSEGFFKHVNGATGYFGDVTKASLIEWILN